MGDLARVLEVQRALDRRRNVRVGAKSFYAEALEDTLHTGEVVETKTEKVGRVVDAVADLRNVPAYEIMGDYSMDEINHMVDHSQYLVKLQIFRDLGPYENLESRNFAESSADGMRHVEPTEEHAWVPSEDICGVLTVVHCSDVCFGGLWFAREMKFCAVVTVGTSDEWSMFVETSEFNLVRHGRAGTCASYGYRRWTFLRRVRRGIISAAKEQSSFIGSSQLHLDSGQFHMLRSLVPSIDLKAVDENKRKQNTSLEWTLNPSRGTYGLLQKAPFEKDRTKLSFTSGAEWGVLTSVVGGGWNIQFAGQTRLLEGSDYGIQQYEMVNAVYDLPQLVDGTTKAKKTPIGVTMVYDESRDLMTVTVSFARVTASVAKDNGALTMKAAPSPPAPPSPSSSSSSSLPSPPSTPQSRSPPRQEQPRGRPRIELQDTRDFPRATTFAEWETKADTSLRRDQRPGRTRHYAIE